MNEPLFFQRVSLPHKAVMIHCLDDRGKQIKNTYGSGFILREEDGLYLYTCWHVVTGLDMHDLPITAEKPKRMALRLSLQKAEERETGDKLRAYVIGGLRTLDIPLYEWRNDRYEPLWHQDPSDRSEDQNHIQIAFPSKHDAVKLRLPDTFRTSDLHVIEQASLCKSLIFPGDRIYVVGFPYNFSTKGLSQPIPIVLTPFIAGTQIKGRLGEILLDGTGAPGMSGGPAFVEKDKQIFLMGLYAGLIYTAGEEKKYKEIGALGTCVDMSLCWGAQDCRTLCHTELTLHSTGSARKPRRPVTLNVKQRNGSTIRGHLRMKLRGVSS